MKKINLIYCITTMLLISFCLILTPFNISGANKMKRSLTEFPSLFVDNTFNKEFPQGVDDYIMDHIPYRNELITAYHWLLASATKDIADNQVLLGKEGWLFFNETLNDYMAVGQLDDWQIEQLSYCIKLQSDYMAAKGSAFKVALAPNKNSIYFEKMPSRFGSPQPEGRNLSRLQNRLGVLGVEYVDLYSVLLSSKGDYPVYYSGDTHWNDLGAYIVYSSLLDAMDLGLQPASCGLEWTYDYKGDLSDMAFPAAAPSELRVHLSNALEYKYGRKPRSMEDISIKTTGSGDYRLLMQRDSFANSIIPLLSGHFSEAYYERETPFNYLKADDARPDIMILEIAERNIPRLLDSAPIMPAIRMEAKPNDMQPVATDKIQLFKEEKNGLLHIYGYIDPDTISTGQKPFIVMENGDCFAAFPVLEKEIVESATEKWGGEVRRCGFSVWVDEADGNFKVYVI